jgi:hypothetical protein
MTPQEHLAEIARLADEMRPHIAGVSGAFVVTVNPASWEESVQVQLDASGILALAPDAEVSLRADDHVARHYRAKVGEVTIRGCEFITEEVAADV